MSVASAGGDENPGEQLHRESPTQGSDSGDHRIEARKQPRTQRLPMSVLRWLAPREQSEEDPVEIGSVTRRHQGAEMMNFGVDTKVGFRSFAAYDT